MRNALAWDEYWRWDVDDEVVAMYYDAADEPQGYLVYLLKREIFKIKEMVYLNDEARRGMWDYVTAHYSMVTESPAATIPTIRWLSRWRTAISARPCSPM